MLFVFCLLFAAACDELKKPKPEPFYAENAAPPLKQEFRWSNGKMPKSFDPAFAAAPPETDIARAVFEGLTDTDPRSLETVPAVAEKWTASDDSKIWTFNLRRDARWSNDKPVTARDFVRSWKRLAEFGDQISNYRLLLNISGSGKLKIPDVINSETRKADAANSADSNISLFKNDTNIANLNIKPEIKTAEFDKNKKPLEKNEKSDKELKFGVEAIDDYTLKVTLIKPDESFPALVAHPIFRPVYDGGDFANLNADIVTNGAFRITSVGQDGVTLDRAENYWNKNEVKLERVRFVPKENSEQALEAYRAGELDAVTNTEFEPLVLKLLMPYDDFRKTKHGALNFYQFNLKNAPFDDRRVREALAIGIERERLTEGETQGATRPALSFSPVDEKHETRLVTDVKKAQKLLSEAGYGGGEDFPVIRLVINRNDTQQRVARSVARMWKENLGIETEIEIKEPAEIENLKKTGDFDLMRRGAILPTADETANLLAIFTPKKEITKKPKTETLPNAKIAETKPINAEPDVEDEPESVFVEHLDEASDAILTEEEAIKELPAIPLYFPTSYSLVKPYVVGFEMNTLDAPSLKDVRINSDWQPDKTNKNS